MGVLSWMTVDVLKLAPSEVSKPSLSLATILADFGVGGHYPYFNPRFTGNLTFSTGSRKPPIIPLRGGRLR